jgi:hypothetical protein
MKPPIEEATAAFRLLAARELLTPLARGTGRQIGRRVLLLAFILGATPERTQRQLARRLKVSEARISQEMRPILAQFRQIFPR